MFGVAYDAHRNIDLLMMLREVDDSYRNNRRTYKLVAKLTYESEGS